MPVYHRRPGCVVLLFPDGSDTNWAYIFTQVPVAEFSSGIALEIMSHERIPVERNCCGNLLLTG